MKLGLVTAAAIAAGTLFAGAPAADAAQGCGIGFHRGFYGVCRPNFGGGYYGGGFYGRPFYGAYRPFGWHRGGCWHCGWHRW